MWFIIEYRDIYNSIAFLFNCLYGGQKVYVVLVSFVFQQCLDLKSYTNVKWLIFWNLFFFNASINIIAKLIKSMSATILLSCYLFKNDQNQ